MVKSWSNSFSCHAHLPTSKDLLQREAQSPDKVALKLRLAHFTCLTAHTLRSCSSQNSWIFWGRLDTLDIPSKESKNTGCSALLDTTALWRWGKHKKEKKKQEYTEIVSSKLLKNIITFWLKILETLLEQLALKCSLQRAFAEEKNWEWKYKLEKYFVTSVENLCWKRKKNKTNKKKHQISYFKLF